MWMREIEVGRWFWNFGRGYDRRRGLESASGMEIIGAGSVWEERWVGGGGVERRDYGICGGGGGETKFRGGHYQAATLTDSKS